MPNVLGTVPTATIVLKRAYDPPARGDGYRILVDRLWPRGIKKEALHLNAWAKSLAPSTETITLLYGAKDREHNEAVVLRDLFERVARE